MMTQRSQTVAAIGVTLVALAKPNGDEDSPEGSYDENLEEARRIMDKYK